MRKLTLGALLATGLLALAPGQADAQRYETYPGWKHSRPYHWCRDKARRLHEYEYRASRDGRLSTNERITISLLRADLDNSCGGGRWHPRRGWHYR